MKYLSGPNIEKSEMDLLQIYQNLHFQQFDISILDGWVYDSPGHMSDQD